MVPPPALSRMPRLALRITALPVSCSVPPSNTSLPAPLACPSWPSVLIERVPPLIVVVPVWSLLLAPSISVPAPVLIRLVLLMEPL